MNIILLIVFSVWALFLFYLPQIIQFIKLKQRLAAFPSPPIWEVFFNHKTHQLLLWFVNLRQRYGSIFRFWNGVDPYIVLTNPDDIKVLLSNNNLVYKSNNYEILIPWLGKGLLVNGGEPWRIRRKFLTPAFHFNILSEFKDVIEQNCKILVKRLEERADGEQFDIYPYMTLYALDVICETAMGIQIHAQTERETPYVKAVNTICRIMHENMFVMLKILKPFHNYTKRGKAFQNCLRTLHNETERVIKMRRQILQNTPTHLMHDADRENDVGQKRRFAFLDMLLIAQMEGKPLNDSDIRDEVDTFMFEGHDTTTSALSFTIYLLSQHAHVQERAYREILSAKNDEEDSLSYLEAIIKESLRLYPSVPMIGRYATEDIRLDTCTIPKNAYVVIFTYMLHREDCYFSEPEKFDPNRFLDISQDMNSFAYVPFSAGPRNCIGLRFAYLELKCTLARLLLNYEFLPVENFKPKLCAELILKSLNGIQIKMRKRTGSGHF